MPGEKESFRLIERFMGRLVFSLNKIHGTNYSSKYWKIIIRPWLRLFLENAVFYSKERDSFNDEKCDTKINVPLDFDAFFDDYFLTEEWRDSLKSMINKSNNVDEALHNDENYNLSVIYKNINDTNYSTGYKKRIESGFCFMSRHIRGGFSTDIINLSLISKIWIKCRLMPRVLRHIPTNLKNTSIIKKKRHRLYKSGRHLCEDNREQVYWKLVCLNIPLIYLEGYNEGRCTASRLFGHFPELIITQDLYSCDLKKFWVAEAIDSGAKIVIAQHGGGYGIMRYDYSEIHETDISDLYLSWYRSETNKIVQVPSQKFATRDKFDKEINGFTLINNALPPYFYKYHSCPVGSQFEKIIEDQITFLKTVKGEVKKKIRVRQEFTEYDWPISLFYRAAKLDHLVDNKSTYSELLNSSELLVISYLGTVCLEALMNNIPSIFFFDPGCWFVRENARPFFDDLRDVKILHNTPESAASHLNSIESHVSVWWNNETLQDVRHRFCEEFSYTEKFWQSKWGDAVRQII